MHILLGGVCVSESVCVCLCACNLCACMCACVHMCICIYIDIRCPTKSYLYKWIGKNPQSFCTHTCITAPGSLIGQEPQTISEPRVYCWCDSPLGGLGETLSRCSSLLPSKSCSIMQCCARHIYICICIYIYMYIYIHQHATRHANSFQTHACIHIYQLVSFVFHQQEKTSIYLKKTIDFLTQGKKSEENH